MIVFGLDLHLGRDFVGVELGNIEAIGQSQTSRIGRTAIDALDPAIVQSVTNAAPLVRVGMEHFENAPALRMGWEGVEYRSTLRVCILVDAGGWSWG